MSHAILFTYDFKGKQHERVKFQRLLYGYTDYSRYGKYKYKRNGLLSKIPHINPTQSCIIIRKKDANKVKKLFKQFKVKFDERAVLLKKGEKIE